MKKVISIMLIVVFCLSLSCVAFAADDDGDLCPTCSGTGWVGSEECYECCPLCHKVSCSLYIDIKSPGKSGVADKYSYFVYCSSGFSLDVLYCSWDELVTLFDGSNSCFVSIDGYLCLSCCPMACAEFFDSHLDSLELYTVVPYGNFHLVSCPHCDEYYLVDVFLNTDGIEDVFHSESESQSCSFCEFLVANGATLSDSVPGSLNSITDATGDTLSASLGWVKQVIQVVVDKPILFIGIALPFIGAGLILFKRLRRV